MIEQLIVLLPMIMLFKMAQFMKQAREMIGSALVEEIWGMLHDNKPFDRGRFRGLLEGLG